MSNRSNCMALALLMVFCTALMGCGGRTAFPLVSPAQAVPASAIAGRHEIFVATTRAPAEDPAYVYGSQRADKLTFARIDVTVPAIHKAGALEWAKGNPIDPSKHFAPVEVRRYNADSAFNRELNESIKRNGGRALIFIHGYNTSFDAAVYRATQIVHDADYGGTAVLFSWPSAGRTLDYVYDNNSATVARDGLEATMRLLADSGATRIDIIAHSMGNWATMEALRQLAITGDGDLNGKLGDVVLASPDIDVDVFRAQMRRYGMPKKPFILMVSRDDRALRVAGLIAGNQPRLGGYGKDKAEIAKLGVVVVDLTDVAAGDNLNHAKFADNPLLIRLLGEHLRNDDDFTNGGEQVSTRVGTMAAALGQTVVSAAEIVVTTPFEVINVVVGR